MKLWRWLDKHFEETIMMAMLSLMVVIMGAQVFMRYVIGRSLGWPEELSRYLFIWISFLGMSYAIRTDTGLKIDIIYTVIPKLKIPLTFVGDFIYFLFCLFMLAPAYSALTRMMKSAQLSSAMQIPMWLVYLSLMVGLVLSILRLLQKYARMLLAKRGPAEGKEE